MAMDDCHSVTYHGLMPPDALMLCTGEPSMPDRWRTSCAAARPAVVDLSKWSN